jgi:hypothetical protein
MIEMDDIRRFLSRVRSRATEGSADEIVSSLKAHKASAVECDKDGEAKGLWCLEETLAVQEWYLKAFRLLKVGKYYDAWCALEQVELAYHRLSRHFQDKGGTFSLDLILEQTRRFQGLFPYHAFFSTGMMQLEKLCTICRRIVEIRNPCGHRVGEIYKGEMCARLITRAELLEISIVWSPRNKYAVAFLVDRGTGSGNDPYDYSLLAYVLRGLRRPFDEWSYTWTKKLRPHSLFVAVAPEAHCPCGSKLRYCDCCLRESGVLMPHCEVLFSLPPPEDLPPEELHFAPLSDPAPTELSASKALA